MPSAPPSSAPVSEIPDAAPARSGRPRPTITSFASVNTGDSRHHDDDGRAPTHQQRGRSRRDLRQQREPDRPRAPARTPSGWPAESPAQQHRRHHRAEPRDAIAHGSVHRPGLERRQPVARAAGTAGRTGRAPNTATGSPTCRRSPATALNAGRRNSRRSISGSASRRCRRTNTHADAEAGHDRQRGSQPSRPRRSA